MDARAQTRRKIETELRAAVQGDTLRPYYQPLVDLASGRSPASKRWCVGRIPSAA